MRVRWDTHLVDDALRRVAETATYETVGTDAPWDYLAYCGDHLRGVLVDALASVKPMSLGEWNADRDLADAVSGDTTRDEGMIGARAELCMAWLHHLLELRMTRLETALRQTASDLERYVTEDDRIACEMSAIAAKARRALVGDRRPAEEIDGPAAPSAPGAWGQTDTEGTT